MGEFPFKTWPYEEQTKRKHLVFEDYLDKWIKILGKYNKLNYIDCFGGCGAYNDRDGKIYYGSPIIALKTIKKNKIDLGRKVSISIIEKKSKSIENIKKIIQYLDLNIKPFFIESDFDKEINRLLDKIPNLAPTFFFVDPFGFSIKIETLKRIMKRPKTEIFLNFMFNGVSRFLKLRQFEKIFDNLFGSQNWRIACNMEGEEREKCIVGMFTNELKKVSKFVYPYRMCFSGKSRTYYYLIHLTNNYKGCSIMKSCFAKHNFGRDEFSGGSYQKTLDETEIFKIHELKKFLMGEYHGQKKNFFDLCEKNICKPTYLESDFRKALRNLEKEKKVIIKRSSPITPTGKIRESIKYEDNIEFI